MGGKRFQPWGRSHEKGATQTSTVIFEGSFIFLELSSVKKVVSLTNLNLKVDEAVIFD